uniref:Uncharacterized protein n=1 Tax=Attheya septentrionalis TaxID=420275 RepID=A0A7S2XLU5_9STRA|mmetsp:Transcript_17800/g.32223  ORF Transcript_17800/g.32223 Transcript_17800/m.32223 type:complete len:246 (+) Transcript_17800:169-906(+)
MTPKPASNLNELVDGVARIAVAALPEPLLSKSSNECIYIVPQVDPMTRRIEDTPHDGQHWEKSPPIASVFKTPSGNRRSRPNPLWDSGVLSPSLLLPSLFTPEAPRSRKRNKRTELRKRHLEVCQDDLLGPPPSPVMDALFLPSRTIHSAPSSKFSADQLVTPPRNDDAKQTMIQTDSPSVPSMEELIVSIPLPDLRGSSFSNGASVRKLRQQLRPRSRAAPMTRHHNTPVSGRCIEAFQNLSVF